MKNIDVIRAWKDEEYRLSLSENELANLPAHPAGLIELTDVDLDQAAGAWGKPTFWTICQTRCYCSWFGQCGTGCVCNPEVCAPLK